MRFLQLINLVAIFFCVAVFLTGLYDATVKLQKYGDPYTETVTVGNHTETRTVTFKQNVSVALVFLALAGILAVNYMVIRQYERTLQPKPYMIT